MLLCALASSCAHYPRNDPLQSYRPEQGYRFDALRDGGNTDSLFLCLTLSGGGTRAAALAYGVLRRLDEVTITWKGKQKRLLDEIDCISSVSGGSFTAAYYALFGRRLFQDFRARFLDRDVQQALFHRVFYPGNLVRLLSPYFGPIDLAVDNYSFETIEMIRELGAERVKAQQVVAACQRRLAERCPGAPGLPTFAIAVDPHVIELNFEMIPDPQRRRYFLGLPTTLNVNTGVEDLPDLASGIPRDGGFGTTETVPGSGVFGNGAFNAPALVEAADTGPFFHNNAVNTIEEAIAFFNSPEFNNSRANDAKIQLDSEQVKAVAVFLRIINALENIRSASELAQTALGRTPLASARPPLRLAIADTADGIRVLLEKGLHPDAVVALRAARRLLDRAGDTASNVRRDALIRLAIAALNSAHDTMVL
ncbi:MAG: patatin-like phospholipase family protein [Gammaproteobacteria bacterium]